jgi:transposase
MGSKKDTRGARIRLTRQQQRKLKELQRSAEVDGLSARRARILELLGQGLGQNEVQAATGAGIATVGRTRRRFLEEGLEAAVFGYEAPGAARLLNAAEEARIVALACCDPPAGRSKWTTQLLAEHAIARGFVARVGRETVRLVLKHHGLKPWREKNVVRAQAR